MVVEVVVVWEEWNESDLLRRSPFSITPLPGNLVCLSISSPLQRWLYVYVAVTVAAYTASTVRTKEQGLLSKMPQQKRQRRVIAIENFSTVLSHHPHFQKREYYETEKHNGDNVTPANAQYDRYDVGAYSKVDVTFRAEIHLHAKLVVERRVDRVCHQPFADTT